MTTFIARSGVNYTATVNVSQASATEELIQGPAFFYREMYRADLADTVKAFRFRWPSYYDSYVGDPRKPLALSFDQLNFGRLARAAADVMRAGGIVSIGAHNSPGLFTQFEMWSLQRAGASPMEVLRAATINGAAKLGLGAEVGTIEVGKLADFLVLSANPLDDIRNTNRMTYVVANGVIYDAETLTQLWPIYRRPPRMVWQSPEEYARIPFPQPWPSSSEGSAGTR